MGDNRDNLGRLQDIEDKSQVERLGYNRAVIRTGTVQEKPEAETDGDTETNSEPEVSKKFTMKVQVERDGKLKRTKLKSETMRGLIQKFAFWASSVSDEDLEDVLKQV